MQIFGTYLGITEIIIGAVILYLLFSVFRSRGGNAIIGNLVLTRYDINLQEATNYVDIEGRRSGLIAWIMNLIGMAKNYKITVTGRFVTINAIGNFDKDEFNVPISMISATYWGLRRPVWALLLGIIIIAAGLLARGGIGPALIGIVVGAIVIYFLYWRGQTIEVRVSPDGSTFYGFNFYKRSEGTVEKAMKTAAIINRLTYAVAKRKEEE